MEQETQGKAKGARGGIARAKKLTPEERKEIARKGAQARWNQPIEGLPKATHRGEVVIGDIKIPCAVLDNGKRVISETGLANAILGTRSGASIRLKKAHEEAGAPMPVFIAPKMLKPFIHADLMTGALSPIQYTDKYRMINAFDANLLPAVCDIWLKAREAGALQKQQLDKAQKAEILMRGLAHVGIIALVDEATGYQAERDKDGLQKFLALYLSEERLKWAKMFPDEYYKQLFRLRGWTYSPMSVKRPKLVGKLTNQLVYKKLPANVIEDLRRLNPVKNKKTWRREATHVQHLSKDIGQKDLRDHLLQLITVMRVSRNWDAFKRNFAQAFPTPGTQIEMFDESDED